MPDPAPEPQPSPAARLGLGDDDNRPLRSLVEAGYTFLARGDAAAALDVFAGLMPLLPDDPAPWLGAAEARLLMNEPRQADREAQSALRRGKASADTAAQALVLLGDAATMSGRGQRATTYWRKAEALAPGSPSAEVARGRLGEVQPSD